MFTQVSDFWTGWAPIFDQFGNLIGAVSIGFGALGGFLSRPWR